VPTPAIGLLVASFPLIYWTSPWEGVSHFFENTWSIYALSVLLCWLMVSNLPLLALKFSGDNWKRKLSPFLIMAALALLSAFFLQWLAVPVVFLAYIVLSLAFKNKS
jgi:CDP-diacylglycerol--serine O-phosphatidyltransferase